MERIIGMDIGNHSVKTSGGVIFRSMLEQYDYKHEIANDDSLRYDGVEYVIGKGGMVDNTKLKSEKKHTIPLFLHALYHTLGVTRADVKVIIGLPLSHHKDKDLIKDIKEMYSGVFSFQYLVDRIPINIQYNVTEVLVFPEALGAFYSLDEDMLGRDILLIDIGGGTVNIALFSDGEYEDSITIQEGMNDVYSQIANKANFINKGASFTTEHIIKYMNRGNIKWKGKVDNMEYVENIKETFANNILNQIKGLFPLYQAYEIFLSGGGAYEISNELNTCFVGNGCPPIEIINDNVFANSIGFYRVGSVR